MTIRPKVSIIIPTRGQEGYLEQALESVFAQTYQDYEIIVVDGAPEGLPEKIKNSPRLQRIYQLPQGVAAARNIGLESARGEFAAFLDSDDLWDAHILESQVNGLERFPTAILAFTDFRKFGDEYKGESSLPMRYRKPFQDWVLKYRMDYPNLSISYGSLYQTLILGNVIPTSSVLLRTKEALRIGSFDETLKIAEDYDYWLRLTALHPVVYLHQILVSYRVRESGLSGPQDLRLCRFAEAHIRVFEKQLYHPIRAIQKGERKALHERLAHIHLHLGIETLRTLGNVKEACSQISMALGMMKTVGVTFVHDHHRGWEKLCLLIKPYVLWFLTRMFGPVLQPFLRFLKRKQLA